MSLQYASRPKSADILTKIQEDVCLYQTCYICVRANGADAQMSPQDGLFISESSTTSR